MSSITKIKVADTTYDIKDNVSGYITKDVDDLTNYYEWLKKSKRGCHRIK
mgnify:CR=1 FL=1